MYSISFLNHKPRTLNLKFIIDLYLLYYDENCNSFVLIFYETATTLLSRVICHINVLAILCGNETWQEFFLILSAVKTTKL